MDFVNHTLALLHFLDYITYFNMMEKEDTVQHVEGPTSASDSEKGVPNNTLPINDEDYEVTFKTWVVVTILASAYGVSSTTCSAESPTDIITGVLLDCPCHRHHLNSGCN